MKLSTYFLTAGLIVFLCVNCLPSALAVEQLGDTDLPKIPEPNVIDPNLAAFVAADYLPAFYPSDWEFCKHLVCYDLDGEPAAYIIIFRDPNSTTKTWEEVNVQVKQASDELDELDWQIRIIKASKQTPQDDKVKMIKERKAQKIGKLRRSYLSGDFATVITGATDQSELLIRCYRGLPEVLVDKPKLKKRLNIRFKNKGLELEEIIYLNPSDIRYKLKSKKIKSQNEEEVVEALAAEEGYLFSAKEAKLEKISEKRQQREDLKAQKKKRLESLSPKNKKLLEEGEVKGKLNNIEKWAEYEQFYLEELSKQQNGEDSK